MMENKKIEEYIKVQLKNRDLSNTKKAELRMVREIYLKGKERKVILEKYNISKATLSRIEKRFFKALESNEVYADRKLGNNKLTISQQKFINNILLNEPINSKIPFYCWDKKLLKKYIKFKFDVEYTERQCNNILNSSMATTITEKCQKYIRSFNNKYILDIIFVGNKSTYSEVLKKRKDNRRYIGRVSELKVYMGILCSKETVNITKSFKMEMNYFDILKEFIDVLVKDIDDLNDSIIVLEHKDLKLEQVLEIESKYKYLNLIWVSNLAEVEELIPTDIQYKKQVICNQRDLINFKYRGRFKKDYNIK